MLTDQEITNRHKLRWDDLIAKYGDKHSVPTDEMFRIGELLRADYVSQMFFRKDVGSTLAQTLREYGISHSVIFELTGGEPEVVRRRKMADKYKAVFDWCIANPGKTTTAQEVATVGNISLSSATTLIKDRIDYFKRVKRGEYIIRNPAAERAEEK